MPDTAPAPLLAASPRAPFASDAAASRGRRHLEAESATRNPFERDRDRIIHTTAFRRLKQKTQVFVAHEGDHYRTRLTHSLEVAQIARSIARQLGLNEDLAEACALAHDLGHPPFGHTGEDALDACMADYGGFDHNAQTMRVITKLERRYPHFDGVNLTWETLEGVLKHNGPLLRPGQATSELAPVYREWVDEYDLEVHTYAGPEAQVAALADDIAYNNHDIDDGLRAGFFTIEELVDSVPLARDAFESVWRDFPSLDRERVVDEAVRRLIGAWVNDLIAETRRTIAATKPSAASDVRALGRPLVSFSKDMTERAGALRRFLYARFYRHWQVNRVRSQARRIVQDLFNLFLAEPENLPPAWQARAVERPPEKAARAVCDYIASMTDNFAIEEHRKLFNLERLL